MLKNTNLYKKEQLSNIKSQNLVKRRAFKDLTNEITSYQLKNDFMVEGLVENFQQIPKHDYPLGLDTKSPILTPLNRSQLYMNLDQENMANMTQNTRFNKSSYLLARRDTQDTLQTDRITNITTFTQNTCEDNFPTFSEYNDTLSKSSKTQGKVLSGIDMPLKDQRKESIFGRPKHSLEDGISIQTGSMDFSRQSSIPDNENYMNIVNLNSIQSKNSSKCFGGISQQDHSLEYFPSTSTNGTQKSKNNYTNKDIMRINIDYIGTADQLLLEDQKGTISWRFQNQCSTTRNKAGESTFVLSDDRAFVSGSQISKSRRSSQRYCGMHSIESHISKTLNETLKEFFLVEQDESSYFDERDLAHL